MRLKELRDRIVSRHRSWEGYQNISAALKVPKNTVASIILKWKKFVITKTLPRTEQTEQSGEKGLGQGGDQETDSHSDRAPVPLWRWESLPEGQPSLQHSTNPAFMVE
jgi:hypothetical protein